MRTTLNIEDGLIDKASKMTGIKEKTTLVKLGLEALIAREDLWKTPSPCHPEAPSFGGERTYATLRAGDAAGELPAVRRRSARRVA